MTMKDEIIIKNTFPFFPSLLASFSFFSGVQVFSVTNTYVAADDLFCCAYTRRFESIFSGNASFFLPSPLFYFYLLEEKEPKTKSHDE